MNDVITFTTKGCYNHFHGVYFESKNKHWTLNAVYLQKQNIYVVELHKNNNVFDRQYLKLVPVEDVRGKYCELLRNGISGFTIKTHGLHLYDLIEESFYDLLQKEYDLNKMENSTPINDNDKE